MVLKVNGLRKTFASSKGEASKEVLAVNDVSFEVSEGELFTLLGPSGCGKTTTLRSIAGLEVPSAGEIRVGESVLYSKERRICLRANERGLGMVFQSYAIWPHMNVFKNVAFPLEVLPRKQRPSRREVADRVERVLTVVQLEHLATRPATDLSGGQQQRLALARALVMEPPLLLLDEPLSNLDAKLREDMRFELKRLQRDLNITAVYVTHDQVEALAMSNRIAVMNGGNFEQVGKPRDVYARPTSRFVADFIGTTNFIEGKIEARGEDGGVVIRTSWGGYLTSSAFGSAVSPGQNVLVSVRPENVGIDEVSAAGGEAEGRWQGEVVTRMFLGESVDHEIRIGPEFSIRARCNPSMSYAPGTTVLVKIGPDSTSVIPV